MRAVPFLANPQEKPAPLTKETRKKSDLFTVAGIIAFIAGLILISSGVISTSLVLTILEYVNRHLGTSPTMLHSILRFAIAILTFLVGLGGILVTAGGILFLFKHGLSGRILIGLGGGMAILGLLFSVGEAFYISGFSSEVFHQSYFTWYWVGAVLALIAIILSRKTFARKAEQSNGQSLTAVGHN